MRYECRDGSMAPPEAACAAKRGAHRTAPCVLRASVTPCDPVTSEYSVSSSSPEPVRHLHEKDIVAGGGEQRGGVATNAEFAGVGEVLLLTLPDGVQI